MNNQIGLIECGKTEAIVQMIESGNLQGQHIKKIHFHHKALATKLKSQFPHLQIVEDTTDIIHDESISEVIVSSPGSCDKEILGALLKAGKQVKVME
ncbi:MAG TPA: hypothetical protein VNS32_28950 [Flavisolibacter sp.]|nr:hypothetical protein [Flavisolibacter sp.]